MRGHATAPTASDRAAVLAERSLLLPAVETGSGPFAGRTAFWTTPPERLSDGERAVVVSYYLALVTSVCLAEVGARGPTIIEGPFAANDDFCAMLGSATGRPVIRNLSGTGTSVGTARLIASASVATAADAATRPDAPDLAAYAADWQEAIREWGHRHVFHA